MRHRRWAGAERSPLATRKMVDGNEEDDIGAERIVEPILQVHGATDTGNGQPPHHQEAAPPRGVGYAAQPVQAK